MAVWLVRAGKHGEQEREAIAHDVAVIGWNKLPDLSDVQDRDELMNVFSQQCGGSPREIASRASQIWAFLSIRKGDLVLLPLKKSRLIAVGSATGNYRYRTDLGDDIRHTQSVKWLSRKLCRSELDEDILNSLGAAMTVCRIKRNNAEERIRGLLGRDSPQ